MCSKSRRNRRGIWEKRSSVAPYPFRYLGSHLLQGRAPRHGEALLPGHPLWQLSGWRHICLFAAPFGGPHSSRCPFKKEEILFINKRPNLSVQPAASPAGFRVMGATFRQRTSHRLNPGERLGGRPFLGAAPGCSRLGFEESGGGT